MRELQQDKTRKLLAALIMLAVPFLVVLGMRIPYIKGDFEKVKQQPRAIFKDTQKQCIKLVIVKKPESSPIPSDNIQGTEITLCLLVQAIKPADPVDYPVTLYNLCRIPPRASPLSVSTHPYFTV